MSKIARKPELWPITNITPYELNVKKHEKEQVARICESIRKFGFDVPIVVDKHGVIIKGHGRRLAALELGMTEVPVIVREDLSPEQVRAARLADNRVAQGDIDTGMLQEELEGIDDLLDGIFDAKEIDFMTADLGDVNEDAFVEDMGEVLDEQKRDLQERADSAAGGRVPLHKAFGFKDIPASAQIHITRLMSKAEAATGLAGEEALLAFASEMA
jgi:hypothetical protein